MIVSTAAINVKSTSSWKILNITIITNASCNNASTADNAYVNRKRILTYKMITAEAISTAINAFRAISLPIVGETVLTFGSVPYLSWKNVFVFAISSFDKTPNVRTAKPLLSSPVGTIFFFLHINVQFFKIFYEHQTQ